MRWKWVAAIGVLIIAILIAAVYGYLNTYDYNRLKPLVARRVEDATGRKLTLGGEVNLAIGPLGLLAPFIHLGANQAHPCNIQSIGRLGLKSPGPE